MIKSPFCGAYKIIILGHNHLCLTARVKVYTDENHLTYTLLNVLNDYISLYYYIKSYLYAY